MTLLTHYRALLEGYIDAKDHTRPERIADVFASDAILTFSLATTNIAFPARTVGAEAIAKTLVIDFGAQYSQCMTWYVCDDLRVDDDGCVTVPWLVVMREPAARTLRVGNGHYRWTFGSLDATPRVTAFHIHIARMDVVADPDARLVETLQQGLSYPWLTPRELRERFGAIAMQEPALRFVEGFAEPALPPSVS
ncbi:hypothetical protein [Paraburkholderia phosphatilytica]|uniref:hypothetical protein n=1 Tax=Paraburkholderia phosphatilytica TaxID=2282883 RepID=UPI000E4F2269|nr:hypothetical protein [Paraburkholderia phosphatilytica]